MTPDTTRRRVLVVEDSPTQAEALRALLEDGGYEVDVALSGERALAMLADFRPDLVLSDVVMPGLSGFDLCRGLKQGYGTRDLPVVLLTSLADPMDVVRGLECGADNYITKPYDPRHLLSRVGRVFQNRELRSAGPGDGVDITFLGTRFHIQSGKEQILDLLISSFEELIRSNEALRASEEERARQLAGEQHARAEAEATARRLRLLQMISDAALADAPLDEFLDTVTRQVQAALGADTVAVLLLDEGGEELAMRASRGLEEAGDADLRVPMGEGIAGSIARSGRGELVDDLGLRENGANGVVRERARSLVGAPLVAGRTPVGVLLAGSQEYRRFTRDDLQLMRLVADRVAAFIDRTRLLERERDARLDAEHARRRAEDANRFKGEFLAMMSHDLRTPLNAIGGYADLIAMGLRGPVSDQQLHDLERIKQNQRHLLALVNDLLNVARVEAGEVPLSITDVPLQVVVQRAHAAIEPQLTRKGLSYELDAPDPLVVRADRERLDQVILNLLTNAIKYTNPGGAVSLRCATEGNRVRFSVSDTGVGIPAEKLESIFDPFVQLDAQRRGERDGVGLGLAISRNLVRLMGGELEVRSEVGRGSTFTFALPAGRRRAAAHQHEDTPNREDLP